MAEPILTARGLVKRYGRVTALNDGITPKTMQVTAVRADGTEVVFDAVVRIDTPGERGYYVNGGIMQYVLRQLAKA